MREIKDSGIEYVGNVPKSWDIKPVRAVFREVTTKNKQGDVKTALKFTYGNIVLKDNFDADDDSYVADTILNYTVVEPGTIMLNGLNLNFDFITQRIGLVKEKGIITSAYMAFKPIDTSYMLPEYATYLFKSYDACKAFHNMGGGVRKILNFQEFKHHYVVVPSISEQHEIVSFLDRKCSEIDSLTADIEEQIEMLEQYKRSVITEAVTKGLDPVAEMKDSGVEWIGEIPKEWNLQKVKTIFYVIGGCGFKDIYQGEETGDYPFMKASDINGSGKYVTTAANYVSQELATQEHYNIIPKNSIVMAKIGEALKKNHRHINTVDCIVDNNCQAISLLDDSLNIDFYYYLMLCVDMIWFDNGGTIPCVNNRAFLNSFIPVPTNVEQYEIVTFLDRKCAEINSIIADKQSQLDALSEYKKSLIYEYATGKKEVPAS